MAPMALPAAGEDNGGQFTTHHVEDTRMRVKGLSMVYTTESVLVESSTQTMEKFLVEDKYQVIGFDIEFTSGHAGQDQKVDVA
ncbi:putative methyltransferase PMT27 [Hordeum vulgare]|nr:putative methyltransferase PMT27 [Hordeum vulgare]